MKSLISLTLFSIILLSSPSVSAQDASTAESTNQQTRLPYEVIVTPLVTRYNLRNLIIQAEEDFVARFNELNLDDDYDIDCYKFTPTMSHIRERICEPQFLIAERADNAGQFAAGHITFLLTTNTIRRDMNRDYVILQEKFDELTSSDKNLRGIGLVLGALKNRLETLGKED